MLILDAIPIIKEIPQVKESINKSALYATFKPVKKPFQNAFNKVLEEQKKELMKKINEKKIEMKIK